MKIIPCTPDLYTTFGSLFADYYAELGCDDDCEALLADCVLPDFEAGLLKILLAAAAEPIGFVIYQTDDIDNDWNFMEGWGDIREIYVAPACRGKGCGSALLAAAENDLGDKIYLLPDEKSERFFIARGYGDNGGYCPELDSKVFEKLK